MSMTRQYLCGELSLRLALLQQVAGAGSAATIEDLRHRAESTTPATLPAIIAEALRVCTASCWDALAAGDIAGFEQLAGQAAQLREFAVCAQLLDED